MIEETRSALQITRQMGFGSYKTVHGMCHKIRAAMIEPEQKLGGIVEVDETYIGGKAYNQHRSKRTHIRGGGDKTPVIGAVQRKGNVTARVFDRVTKAAAERFVREAVSHKVSLLATDDHPIYDDLKDYPHKRIEHQIGQHTNTIEVFWSIFKRGIVGTFHKVGDKYLALYVAEFQFPYNNRAN
ncbi:MAG: IS1595 family transposase [Rhodoplanes sp.]